MNYLLIKNGYVIKDSSIVVEDILVGGNKILQMGQKLERPTSETPIIDATGKYLMPGVIDFNRHYLDLVKEEESRNELKRLNQAQIFNGTTTMIDTIEDCYDKNYIYNIFKAKEKSQNNLIDYGFHLTFSELKKYSPEAITYSYIHEGVSTFMLSANLMTETDKKEIESIIKNASKYQILIVCDLNLPENSKSDLEEIEFNSSVNLASHFKTLTTLIDLGLKYNCPLLFLNVKFQEELDLIQDGIDNGGDFYVSLRMWFNLGDPKNRKENQHQTFELLANTNKLHPIVDEEVWYLIKSRRYLINPPLYNFTFEENTNEELVYNRPDAYFYIRNYMSMLYSVGVMQKHITMLQLVDILSTRPAKLMGLWPQKGTLRPGADADIVVWNPTFDRNLYCSMPNASDEESQSFKLKGRTDFVFIKGRMVYNGESFYPKQSEGAFVFRSSKSV